MRAKQRHHVVRIWIAPQHGLREDQVAAHVDVEDAVGTGDELDAADGRLELFENPRCQTDSVRQRASGNAVLDADVRLVGHRRHRNRLPGRVAPIAAGHEAEGVTSA